MARLAEGAGMGGLGQASLGYGGVEASLGNGVVRLAYGRWGEANLG